jgi:cytochrome bd-type quinol oxidase subunit 2
MNEASLRNLTGVILILTPVAFNVFFTLLTVTFEYPDILREPTDRILRQFDAGGGGLVAIWYGFMLTAVLFVPVAVLVHKVLTRQGTPYMAVATAFGVVAGVVQFLGLVRWPFLVPYLADTYLDPASSEATREAVAVAFHRLSTIMRA